MREHTEFMLYPRIVIWVLALAIVGALQLIVATGQVSPGSRANLPSAKTPAGNRTLPAATEPKLPLCPAAGLPTLQPSPRTGHHKVTLSWNASAPSVNSESKAVGYCLYRSKKKDAAKQNPTCRDCEQINSIAIAGTGCVDDLVEDGAIYYYVVTAITTQGNPSSPSNAILIQIPASKESANPVSVGSDPLCRRFGNR